MGTVPDVETSPHPRGGLLRTVVAAKLANLSQRQFEMGCEAGHIPVRVEQIGRLKFVRADQFMLWLHPSEPLGAPLKPRGTTAPADLFGEAQ